MPVLPVHFYTNPDVVQVAKDLLGKYLVICFDGLLTAGKIVETEAYRAPEDRASHAFDNRRTPHHVCRRRSGFCLTLLRHPPPLQRGRRAGGHGTHRAYPGSGTHSNHNSPPQANTCNGLFPSPCPTFLTPNSTPSCRSVPARRRAHRHRCRGCCPRSRGRQSRFRW
ncbi:MAG: DNA-3-methyladenine glycosylase [Bacteroidetes bacterium]|nr:DNA-3-methyladenine glycosylase [Bacteroidota bacterium]